MKVHLKQIKADGLHLEGEEDWPIPELEAEGIKCAGPLRYKIDIGLTGNALWANGSLKQPIEVSCVACLEKFVHEIDVPAFAVHEELHGPETVDLTPFVREDILLNLPAYPRCDADGKRECKRPVTIETPDDDAKREQAWSALDKLKLEKK
ncbi:MAG: YceD family protein [Spartobacteria bacterium]